MFPDLGGLKSLKTKRCYFFFLISGCFIFFWALLKGICFVFERAHVSFRFLKQIRVCLMYTVMFLYVFLQCFCCVVGLSLLFHGLLGFPMFSTGYQVACRFYISMSMRGDFL